MSTRFEELAWRVTPLGEISLRRRRDPASGTWIYEVKLGEEYLMSSLFTVAEVELARLALADLPGPRLDVAVGGLGLGFTAAAVLDNPAITSLVVVEAIAEVIDWHRRALVPAGARLTADERCRLVHGDFFAMTAGHGFDPDRPARRFHAVIVDIDHSPRHYLSPRHGAFYTVPGLRRLAEHLHPGGVFALWSNDPPDPDFTSCLAQVFLHVHATIIAFPNPLQDREATNTVYLATTTSE